MSDAAPYKYAKTLAFRQVDPARDARRLIAYGRGLYRESVGSEIPFQREYGVSGQKFPLWIAACSSRDPSLSVFLMEDNREIGFAVAGVDRRENTLGRLHHLFVEPVWRGQGFGGLLDDYVRTKLRAAGCRRMRLNVTARNVRAIRFYIAQGWRVIGGGALREMEVAL